MQTQYLMPASAASMIASAANGGGTNTIEASALVSSTAPFMVLKTGRPRCVRAAFAGRHAADDVGAVVDHFLGVERADAAGEALDEDRRIFVDEDGHCVFLPYAAFLAAATALLAASASVSALIMVRPL